MVTVRSGIRQADVVKVPLGETVLPVETVEVAWKSYSVPQVSPLSTMEWLVTSVALLTLLP